MTSDDSGVNTILVKSAPRRPIAKADRRDAGAAVLGGAAGASGVGAVRSRRTVRLKRAESAALHEQAGDSFRTVQARLARQASSGKGSIAADSKSLNHTHDLIVAAREHESGASAAAREAIRAGRGARGKAAAAAVLGGGAVALGSRRDRQPRSSVGYR